MQTAPLQHDTVLGNAEPPTEDATVDLTDPPLPEETTDDGFVPL